MGTIGTIGWGGRRRPQLLRRRSCGWVGRRLPRWHDADPAGALGVRQVELLTAHLARCPRCLQTAREVRSVAGSLARIALRRRVASRVASRVATGVPARALLAVDRKNP